MRGVKLAAAGAIGYTLGTFPTADLVSRRASGGRVDLRSTGSGNPGTVNAMNTLGRAAGTAVLIGDIAKGSLACTLGSAIAGPAGAHLGGVAAVYGHCYPVWNGFRGGKGVATSIGQCLATFPAYFPIDALVGGATLAMPWWRQRAFAASAVASTTWVIAGMVWWRRGWSNAWGPQPSVALPIAAAASSLAIAIRFAGANAGKPSGS